ncbi:dual specificity protein phosphatase family protein [Roseomonas sp. SSH11]|uniref:Dual specificity protein phosphatase family protein n=1 Tax=Pararoseomonas baculiformis TaxID=2820812 RepID=A0ABS4A821_9PROT|nr:dual specificity protein phosphatase family protein [Pararoseomonas baculiformis]MBP0443148.1 dual specificity protein phosphatase family protein [Pararoseomonas baculiformis]
MTWAQRWKRAFAAVLTLQDPDQRQSRRLRFHQDPHPDHLVLCFVDMDRPAPPPYAAMPVFRMAERADIERALEFGRASASGGRLLVHCNVGVGRSPAVALAIIADRLGPGREREALDELIRIRPQSVPNLHVLALADAILGRDVALVRTVLEWERDRPENTARRRDNRAAHLAYYGVPLSADD